IRTGVLRLSPPPNRNNNDPAIMNSADSNPTQQPVLTPEAILERHEHVLRHINQQLAALTQVLAQHLPSVSAPSPPPSVSPQLSAPNPSAAAPPVPPAPASTEPPEQSLPAPEPFLGEFDKCGGFLTQITLQFRQLRRTYETDGAKIAFMVQLLRGQALNWAQAVLRTAPEISYEDFLTKFKSVFERGTGAEAATHRLLNLKQGRWSMADFSVEFWTLAEETGWGQSALISTLLNNTTSGGGVLSGSHASDSMEEGEQPMQLGRSRLSPEERYRRWRAGECFYCGRRGHIAMDCPARPKDSARQ
uniref:CCHC-type domain-containing protein n=1 Tax=Oreochromis aureus TaxID=47969 RepID=A0AAZ1X0G2_OREAU